MKRWGWMFLVILSSLFIENIKAQQWFNYDPTVGFDINTVDILKPGYILTGGGSNAGNNFQIMFSSPDYGVTWAENSDDGLQSWNMSIAFSDTLNGFGVGFNGRIINTGDGGFSWPNVNNIINRDFTKIVNVTPLIYYAVGGEPNDSVQTIVKTSDGGLIWTVMRDTIGPWLKSVYFINSVTGFAVGDSGVILSTTNGGTSWSVIAPPVIRDFDAITFINPDTGFIAGGSQSLGRSTMLQTVNGGASWTLLLDTPGGILNDISFASSTIGYVAGDSATLLKTVDAGFTWTRQFISNALTGTETFRAVKFYNPNFGVVGGRAGILYIYTGWPVDLVTLGPVEQDSTDVSLLASIHTHGYPEAINFIYSTDSTFATYQSTQTQNYTLDTFQPISVTVSNLTANTWYYYFVSAGTKSGDTLRFYTGQAPVPNFSTLAGNIIDSITLNLNGDVHGINPVTNLAFEYGTTPYLGSVLTASPSSVSDVADHAISGTLNSVQPYTIYYYRLRGLNGADTLRGDIYATGSLYHILQTYPAAFVGDTNATFLGAEQGFPGAVSLDFEYWQPGAPRLLTNGVFNFTTSDTIHSILDVAHSLQPHRFYYYHIRAQSSEGINYGNPEMFYTGQMDSLIQTFPAQGLTLTSAMLQGKVNGFPDSATLSFEYGTDSTLGSEIPALPGLVSDSLYLLVSALLTGVPVNTEYYYRLKAITGFGDSVVGNIQQVYLGNEIPNWDFQNWTTQTYAIPEGWNIFANGFKQVPGHSGNYALNLSGINLATLNSLPNPGGGGPLQPPFFGGKPFTDRPDSITFYVDASFTSGDQGAFLALLFANNTAVGAAQYVLTSTGHSFQRVSIPLTYFSALSPDSLQIQFMSTNPNGTSPLPGFQNNSLTIDDISFVPPTSAVYNGDFETWFDLTKETPDYWFTNQFVFLDSTGPNYQQDTKTYFNPPNDFAVSINDVPIGLQGNQYRWGSLGLDTVFLFGGTQPSFSVNTRHYNLNGYYKSYPVNGDTIIIEVDIFSNNNVVGSGFLNIGDTVSEFTPFTIPISYNLPNESSGFPDAGNIKMVVVPGPGSNPTISHFIIDKLHFDGFVLDTSNYLSIVSPEPGHNGIKVYPNPTRNLVIVELEEPAIDESFIDIFGLTGQLEKELRLPAGTRKISFNVDELASGVHVLEWVNGAETTNKKIVVIK